MTALLATARAIHSASLMAIFGGSIYSALLLRAGLPGLPAKPARLLFASAATLAIVSGIAWLCLIAGQMSGSWQDSVDPTTIGLAATATRFGQIFLGRFGGLAGLWYFCVVGKSSHRLILPILSGALLASLGPVSHAGAGANDIVSTGSISDAAHLLTAGFWLGGLMVLAMFLQRNWSDRASVLGALRIFSTWGTVAVAVLVMTGLINAISILPVSEMSLHNSYFDLLAVKVGLASVMIGLASLNRWRFGPALRTDGAGAMRHLSVSVRSEILLGLAIVAIAGLFGLIAPH